MTASSLDAIRPRRHAWWRVHQASVRRWMRVAFRLAPPGYALKTDLFDEASGDYHHAFDLPPHLRFVGIDADRSVCYTARRRIRDGGMGPACVVGDIRHPPLGRGTLSAVLSLSTLDHFASHDQIRLALTAIYHLLRPGGVLLLSLDNPANPEVALRARLPHALVRRLRADSFPLGKTLSRRRGTRLLTQTGFQVMREFYMGHAIRYPTIRFFAALEQRASSPLIRLAERLTLALEALSTTPLASISGHFVGWIAVRPSDAEVASQEGPPHRP